MSEGPALARQADAIFRRALLEVHAGRAVERCLAFDGRGLVVRAPGAPPRSYPLTSFRRITVIGGGKAAAAMAQALETLLGERISRGLIAVKTGHSLPLGRIEIAEAGHPIPDERGLIAAQRMRDWLEACGEDDLVIALLSGGASALLPAPSSGIGLPEKQEVTRLLLQAGATIYQLNAVRQHLSAAKGGHLAALAYPATVVVLIISDVIGDNPAIIASGPFAPCAATFADAQRIVEQLELWDRLPATVQEHLQKGCHAAVPGPPGPDHPAFERVHTFLLANNRMALKAARDEARAQGFAALILTASLQGEARIVGPVLVAIARAAAHAGDPAPPPLCLLSGGETTVTVRGSGRGGRNLELALAAAAALDGAANILFLSSGSDGTDGATDAAGAWCDGRTAAAARHLGLDPQRFLRDNDSYTFFQQVGGLITTGPTWTNVMDLQIALVT